MKIPEREPDKTVLISGDYEIGIWRDRETGNLTLLGRPASTAEWTFDIAIRFDSRLVKAMFDLTNDSLTIALSQARNRISKTRKKLLNIIKPNLGHPDQAIHEITSEIIEALGTLDGIYDE